jgi:hypothetical protein
MTRQPSGRPAPWVVAIAWAGCLLLGLGLAGLGVAALLAAFRPHHDLPTVVMGVIALLGPLLGAVTITGALQVRGRDPGGFGPANMALKIVGILAFGTMAHSLKNDNWGYFWWSLAVASIIGLLLFALFYVRETLTENT